MQRSAILNVADDVSLECFVLAPTSSSTDSTKKLIVIGHPYGPLGGSASNNVVRAIQTCASQRQGFLAAAFNFRGSGRSSGKTSWTAAPERRDFQAILDHFLSVPNPQQFRGACSHFDIAVVCGYSFGSMIAWSTPPPSRSDISASPLHYAYLIVSPPLGVIAPLTLFHTTPFLPQSCPWLVDPMVPVLAIMGTKDQFTSIGRFESWCTDIGLPKMEETNTEIRSEPRKRRYCVVEDVDHFWFDDEAKVAQIVEQWIADITL